MVTKSHKEAKIISDIRLFDLVYAETIIHEPIDLLAGDLKSSAQWASSTDNQT